MLITFGRQIVNQMLHLLPGLTTSKMLATGMYIINDA